MKRHSALQDLSRDHHVILVHAQRIRKAVERDADERDFRSLADDLLAFYATDLAAHFLEEDEVLAPALRGDAMLSAIGERVRDEHAWLRAAFAQLREQRDARMPIRESLARIESRLTPHIRQEEQEAFEAAQRQLDESQLQDLWRRSHAFRVRNRLPPACGPGPSPQD